MHHFRPKKYLLQCFGIGKREIYKFTLHRPDLHWPAPDGLQVVHEVRGRPGAAGPVEILADRLLRNRPREL